MLATWLLLREVASPLIYWPLGVQRANYLIYRLAAVNWERENDAPEQEKIYCRRIIYNRDGKSDIMSTAEWLS